MTNVSIWMAVAALLISLCSLGVAAATYLRAARYRRQDLHLQEERFRTQHDPSLFLKPQFFLSPGNNRLVAEVTNLHNTIALRDLRIRATSRIEFDGKVEEQQAEGVLDFLKGGASASLPLTPFYCDFDSFLANLGLSRFNRALGQIDVRQALETLRRQGYLKHGQPPVGSLQITWEFRSAQAPTLFTVSDVRYDLYVWEQWYGAFLSFAWPPRVDVPSEDQRRLTTS